MKKPAFIIFILLFGAATLCIGAPHSLASLSTAITTSPTRSLLLTSLPITYSLGTLLTKNTNLQVEQVIPSTYGLNGHVPYLRKHTQTFQNTARKADAVLTINSAWAKDPLYTTARQDNIRIVNIDTTMPFNRRGAGVPTIQTIQKMNMPFVWRSPANLMRMAAITAADLAQMYPEDRTAIEQNTQTLQAELFKLRSGYEILFAQVELPPLAILSDGFLPLLDEFGIIPEFTYLKPEHLWTAENQDNLITQIQKHEIQIILCAWEPSEKAKKIFKKQNVTPIILKPYKPTQEVTAKTLAQWYKNNLDLLIKTSTQ
ncbi:MAG: metal ABC transporter solute-binding protein, Zn/Mn family [Desulfovibrio sp.]